MTTSKVFIHRLAFLFRGLTVACLLLYIFIWQTLQFTESPYYDPQTVTVLHTNSISNSVIPLNKSLPHYVPLRRIVHFDLKGAPPKVPYFIELLKLIKKSGGTGVLIEWEDTFPLSDNLSNANSRVSYTLSEVRHILNTARQLRLQVIPLIQTFGHMEWVLKLKEFADLRDDPRISNVICAANGKAWSTLQELLTQIISVHWEFGIKFVHIGCDEVFKVGVCPAAEAKMKEFGSNVNETKYQYMMWHMARVARYVQSIAPNTRVLAWNDMLMNIPPHHMRVTGLHNLIEPVLWNYAPKLDIKRHTWNVLKPFKFVWAAGVFKGADVPNRYNAHSVRYLRTTESWINQMQTNHENFQEFRGIILTGWSRFDHFSVLCETLPVSVPSMVMSLLTLTQGRQIHNFTKLTVPLIGCHVDQDGQLQSTEKYRTCNFTGFRIWQAFDKLAAIVHWSKFRAVPGAFKTIVQNNVVTAYMGNTNILTSFSSAYHIRQIWSELKEKLADLKRTYRVLDRELRGVFAADAVNELLYDYVYPPLQRLHSLVRLANETLTKRTFRRRPFPELENGNELLAAAERIVEDKQLMQEEN